MFAALRTTLLTSVLVAAAVAQADLVKPTRGAPITARVWDEGADEVTFNVYRTAIRKVTHGTQRLPAKAVKQVVRDPDPHRAFWRRAAALRDGTAHAWHELGAETARNKLRGLARFAFVEALVRDPAHAGARAALDPAGVKMLAADPRANAPLREQLAAYLAARDSAAREPVFTALRQLGCELPQHYLDRACRSALQPKGRTDDRLLTLRGNEHRGVYTLFVPKNYDPLQPTPLLVALHGGGAGGKDGKAVVGSGASAMNFYQTDAGWHGYLVVCPTALAAPWSSPQNDAYLLSVVDEMTMLFNVDRNRIYLTGHSMGGYGAWHYGIEYAHLWAAIAPMAGAGGDDLQKLRSTLTGVYLYHGTNDDVVSPDWDRASAERMRADNMDFVYAEVPDSGHGFPAEVQAEMWEFFACRRLATSPGRAVKGRFTVTEETASSFLDKPGKDELIWFGPLGKEGAGAEVADVAALLRNLKLGGGLARSAAEQLAKSREPGVAAKVAAVLGDQALSPDSRRFAAEVLGKLGDAGTSKALHKALGDPDLAVVAAAAWALATVADAETARRFETCVAELGKRMAGKMTGTHIDFSDFKAHLATVTRLTEAATTLRDPACGKVVVQVARTFLLPQFEVDYSERVGDNPAAVRKQLALAVIEGCRALPGPGVKELLETLAGRDDLGVAALAQTLLAGNR
ncbi:MAG TPA: HEAT repeat domain-containing protein [Planctomycetota bacterium]|nr:HEAT repeat domain-containing protein [Planctomycetota bacterium]